VVAGAPVGPTDDSSAEAISALVNLGYSQTDAWRAVGETSRKEGGAATVEALIRGALSALAPKDRRL
jgi:Holliday junction DNA helicase RuvA